MAGKPKLAGVGRDRATGLGFQIRQHREVEEGKGSLIPTLARPRRGSRTTVRGGATADPPEHAVTAL